MSYGPDLGENYQRTAALADRVKKTKFWGGREPSCRGL